MLRFADFGIEDEFTSWFGAIGVPSVKTCALLLYVSEFRRCVKVEVAALGFPS